MSDDPFLIGGKEGSGDEYGPVPGGIHLAGLAAIIHTPDVPGTAYGTARAITQNLLRLVFVVPEQVDKTGAWKQVRKLINMPDNPLHPNSGVRKFLEQWLGREMTDAEKQTFHLRMMVGARAQLVTQIAESEQKRKFAKLTAISPPPAGLPPWTYTGTVARTPKHPGQVYLLAEGVRIEETDPRQATQQQQAQPQPAQAVQPAAPAQPVQPAATELTEDDIPF